MEGKVWFQPSKQLGCQIPTTIVFSDRPNQNLALVKILYVVRVLQDEQVMIIGMLCNIESLLEEGMSDDLGPRRLSKDMDRYTELGFRLDPNNPMMLLRNENKIITN